MRITSEEFNVLRESFFKEDLAITAKATGGSMKPAILDGTLVQIIPIEPNQIKRGDIILFRINGVATVIHRVSRLFVRNGERYLQTWGDSLTYPDPSVHISQVLGQVKSCQVKEKWITLGNPTRAYMKYFFTRYALYYFRRCTTIIFNSLPFASNK